MINSTSNGSVILYDQRGRGIKLSHGTSIIFDTDFVSLSIANIVQLAAKFTYNNRETEVARIQRNCFQRGRGHQIMIDNGEINFILERQTQPTQLRLDLLMIVQDDDRINKRIIMNNNETDNWNTNSHPFMHHRRMIQESEMDKKETNQVESNCTIPSSEWFTFQRTEIKQYCNEFILYAMMVNTNTTFAIGIVLGSIECLVTIASGGLKVPSTPNVRLNLNMVDCNSQQMLTLRRQLLTTINESSITIDIGSNGSVQLCGDLGNGFLIQGNSIIKLMCIRLCRIKTNVAIDQGPLPSVDLSSFELEDVTVENQRSLTVNVPHVTLIITESAQTVAYVQDFSL